MDDPLAAACDACPAGPGELCDCSIGIHWSRARAAGLSPGEMLAWVPTQRPALPPVHGDDLAIAVAALEAATAIAERLGAPADQIATLRSVAKGVKR